MKVLILEYITGGGLLKEKISPFLAREGELMLGALTRDLTELKDTHVTLLRDVRLGPPVFINQIQEKPDIIYVDTPDRFQHVWRSALQSHDAIWPIAPETGSVLSRLCADVEVSGKQLLNSSSDTVELTASKLRTATLLKKHNIPVVATCSIADFSWDPVGSWVVKPDDGVGGEGARVITNEAEFDRLSLENNVSNWVVQPWVEGESASISILCDRSEVRLLSFNRHRMARQQNVFRIAGCDVSAVAPDSFNYQKLAERIAELLPGLWGYVGVDLMISAGRAVVLEINPRLTTSYVDLRRVLKINPAGLVLDLSASPHSSPGSAVKSG